MIKKNILDFCNQSGHYEPDQQPVITLIKKSSRTGETQGHAVVLQSYYRAKDYLVILAIDSASQTGLFSGYRLVFCPIKFENGRPELLIGDFEDKLCLSAKDCYYINLNWLLKFWISLYTVNKSSVPCMIIYLFLTEVINWSSQSLLKWQRCKNFSRIADVRFNLKISQFSHSHFALFWLLYRIDIAHVDFFSPPQRNLFSVIR